MGRFEDNIEQTVQERIDAAVEKALREQRNRITKMIRTEWLLQDRSGHRGNNIAENNAQTLNHLIEQINKPEGGPKYV